MKALATACAAIALIAVPASAVTIGDAPGSELDIFEVLNAVYGTTFTANSELTQVDLDTFGASAVEVRARYSANSQTIGYATNADPTSPTPSFTSMVDLFTLSNGLLNTDLDPSNDVLITNPADLPLAFYTDLGGGDVIYSVDAWNPNGTERFVVVETGVTGVFLAGFEDGSDFDFNDAMFEIRVIPEPATIGLLGVALAALYVRKRRSNA